MFKPIERSGALPIPAQERVTIVCASRAPKMTHSGVWMIDSQYWGLRATRYRDNEHPCNVPGEPRGCAIATQLLIVNALLDALSVSTGVDLKFTNSNAVPLVQQWLDGDLTVPEWYSGEKLSRLAERLQKRPAGLITVANISTDQSTTAAAALEMAEASRKAYDNRGDKSAQIIFEHEIERILGALTI